jgi:hypothetical protein
VMTPARLSAAGMCMTLFSAPRTLKARIGWTDSILRWT